MSSLARIRRRAVSDAPVGSARKWAITLSVMMVTVMQVLDTSITNVALPHMQGSFSASIDEMSWVITSYLAANAVIIPASGWLTSVFGRRRFFLDLHRDLHGQLVPLRHRAESRVPRRHANSAGARGRLR